MVAGGDINITCERLGLVETQTWVAQPDMTQARAYFNPCVFSDCIYICGKGSFLLEAFHPQQSRYTTLDTQLPVAQECCLYIYRNTLIVRSYDWIAHYQLEGSESRVALQTVEALDCLKHQSSLPVVDQLNGLVYIVRVGKCYAMVADTGMKGPMGDIES